MCVNESNDRVLISVKRLETVFRIKRYINPDYYISLYIIIYHLVSYHRSVAIMQPSSTQRL